MKPTNYEARPPDYAVFLYLARTYSLLHPDMHRSDHVCPETLTSFPDGVVNGAEWYVVTGMDTPFHLQLILRCRCVAGGIKMFCLIRGDIDAIHRL
jgi:hypothetical protein